MGRALEGRLPNPAKTLADLGPTGSLELSHREGQSGSVYLSVRVEAAPGWAMVDARRDPKSAVFRIVGADATRGWGPLGYDILMEYATLLGSGLSPDVYAVSPSARAVWSHYVAHRPDVTKRPESPQVGRRSQATFEHAPFVYTKAPTTLAQLSRVQHVKYEHLWMPYAGPYVARRQNPAHRTAEEHAEALVRAVAAVPGAPRLRAWSKPGIGARVYFASGDFLSIGRGGEIGTTSRGRATFLETNLYPAQRRAYRAGVATYLAELQAHFEAEAGRHENPARKKPAMDPLFDAREAFTLHRTRRAEDEDELPTILEVEPGHRLYHGKQMSWIGRPDLILKLGWDQVKPRQGNIFDPDKVLYFLDIIREAHKAGRRMRFPAPPARLSSPVNMTDVAETQAQRPEDIEYDRMTRPYSSGDEDLDAYLADPEDYIERNTFYKDEDAAREIRDDMVERQALAVRNQTGDLGVVVADLLDGNHRAFAAQLAGEPAIWVHVVEGKEYLQKPRR
jgi:hypothetical protein